MSERMKGTVKGVNMTRKFGFITPDDGSEDLFFLQFVIKSDGVIIQNGAVEFIVGTGNDGRTMACDVSTP
jgi:cold shock CspA family protein